MCTSCIKYWLCSRREERNTKEDQEKDRRNSSGHSYWYYYVFCSAGKDRTGIIAALLLELAGCHDHDIVKDYSESYANNQEIIEALKEMMDEETESFLTSSPRYMMIFLDYLREHYGSAKAYLYHIGMSEEDIEDIKQSFII